MKSFGIVDLVDETWKIGGYILEGFISNQIHSLDLQRLHEALRLRVARDRSSRTA
jgi:hypothetical protein